MNLFAVDMPVDHSASIIDFNLMDCEHTDPRKSLVSEYLSLNQQIP